MPLSEPAVAVIRGDMTESLHLGHIAVTNRDSDVLYALGNPHLFTYARSCAKPLQAIPVVESGAVDRYRFSERELVLMCASHNGENEHIQAAASMLEKQGLSAETLQCGAHFPLYKPRAEEMKKNGMEPSNLHNNCSGKHAGMLSLAGQMNVSSDGYPDPAHPVQQKMLQTVSDMAGLTPAHVHLGVDGCGVPVFGMPLASLAGAFAKLGRPQGLPPARAEACLRILQAIRRHPFYLAGTDRFDTCLAMVTGGRIIGKMGAEGVFAAAVTDKGLGLAVKIEDGAERALYPAVTETLSQLDLLSEREIQELENFRSPVLNNWRGTAVGRLEPVFRLRAASD